MIDLSDYEIKILKIIRGDDVKGVRWGAAISEAIERLKGLGLVGITTHGKYVLTISGWRFLKDRNND